MSFANSSRVTPLRRVVFPLLLIGLLVACSDDEDLPDPSLSSSTSERATSDRETSSTDVRTSPGSSTASSSSSTVDTDSGTTQSTPLEPLDLDPNCDPLNIGDPANSLVTQAACAMPWPSNLYLEPDETRGTGYTLAFGEETLPANNAGVRIDPAPFRRMDGYSLGSPLIVNFPNIDPEGLPSQADLNESLAAESPILWFKVAEDGTLTRIPFWAERDAQGGVVARRSLIVRPAVILEEGTRYVVAMRGLRDRDGDVYEPSEAFRRLRAGTTSQDPLLAARQARFDEIFDILRGADVDVDELQLAWDFVTASSDGLHGYMLDMREEAFELMPEGSDFEFTSVQRFAPTGTCPEPATGEPEPTDCLPEHDDIALRIRGTFQAPHFMVAQETRNNTGWVFNFDEEGRPTVVRDGEGTPELRTGDIWIEVPHSALSGDPQGLVMYGHGLNGSGSQVRGEANASIMNRHGLIFFAISMIGMSGEDVDGILEMVGNFNYFPWLADRLHQGMIEHLLVARGVQHQIEDKLNELLDDVSLFPEEDDLTINIDDGLYWSGISQGGIYGPTVVALSPDIQFGHAGVPGNNYSTLLHRSSNFAPFLGLIRTSYGNRSEEVVLISAIQLLWDGADPVSYVHRISDAPFDEVEPGAILYAPAKGDYQVEVFTNEVAARSEHITIAVMENYDRDLGAPQLITETSYPHQRSGIVLYDHSNPWPAINTNRPPSDDFGDPHGLPRRLVVHNDQMVHFFRNEGEIIDVCSDLPDGPHCFFPREPAQ